MKKRYTTIFLS